MADQKFFDYIGATETDAHKIAENKGMRSITIEKDGAAVVTTTVHHPDRLNFVVAKGVVIHVSFG